MAGSKSNLSPEAKRALIAGAAALAGGALGSYVGGDNHKALGALLGAGAAGGLALSSGALTKLVAGGMGKVSPPPKSSLSGMLTTELPIAAGALSVPIGLQLARPSESRFKAILESVAPKSLFEIDQRTGRPIRKVLSDTELKAYNLLQDYNRYKITSRALPRSWAGIRARIASHRQISSLMDRALNEGVLDSAKKELSLGRFRRLMTNKWVRRPTVYGTAALATVFIGNRILNRIKDNRAKISRGWS